METVLDLLLETDWASHWRALVEARRDSTGPPLEGFGEERWRRWQFSMRGQPDLLLGFLEPWLRADRTLIDVGAGSGRHAVPLAGRLDWVTAVEPSEAMRERLPALDNLTVIASEWLDADAAPADLVVCAHVLYGVADPVPFLRKLEASARERVFLVLRDTPSGHPADQIAGERRPREPRLRDAFLLLRQLGVAPDLAMLRYPVFFRFASLEDAVADCRARLGRLWQEPADLAWLEANLRPDGEGSLVFDAGETVSGVLHWTPKT